MHRIYKYLLKVTDYQFVEMPKGAKVLCVQSQRDIPCVWALVDADNPDLPMEKVGFYTRGTGHAVPVGVVGDYLGTYQLYDGALVFHVFLEKN